MAQALRLPCLAALLTCSPAAACDCLAPPGDPAAPVAGMDICPGVQLKQTHALTAEACCLFCQHAPGEPPLDPGTEHWVMNAVSQPTNCYCKKCAAGSAMVPSPGSVGLGL